MVTILAWRSEGELSTPIHCSNRLMRHLVSSNSYRNNSVPRGHTYLVTVMPAIFYAGHHRLMTHKDHAALSQNWAAAPQRYQLSLAQGLPQQLAWLLSNSHSPREPSSHTPASVLCCSPVNNRQGLHHLHPTNGPCTPHPTHCPQSRCYMQRDHGNLVKLTAAQISQAHIQAISNLCINVPVRGSAAAVGFP